MLTVGNSVISNNSAGFGGGIFSDDAALMNSTLTINNCTLTGNSVPQSGGAIYNRGSTLTITSTTMSGNSASFGGSIFNDASETRGAQLIINSTTVSGNSAATNGGGIYSFGDGNFIPFWVFVSVEMNNCTISGNSAANGAGIFSNGAARGNAFLIVSNSTISGNSASVSGGGIFNDGTLMSGNAVVHLKNSTMSGNSAPTGGGIVSDAQQGGKNPATELFFVNTILKTGAAGANIHNLFGNVFSGGYNLSSDDGGYLICSRRSGQHRPDAWPAPEQRRSDLHA